MLFRSKARAAYLRAIDLDPGHAEAHLNLGRLLHERGDLAGAESHYRQACAARPDSALAAFNLGVALEDQGRGKEAMAVYARALRLDPEHAEAHFNLGRLCEAAQLAEFIIGTELPGRVYRARSSLTGLKATD